MRHAVSDLGLKYKFTDLDIINIGKLSYGIVTIESPSVPPGYSFNTNRDLVWNSAVRAFGGIKQCSQQHRCICGFWDDELYMSYVRFSLPETAYGLLPAIYGEELKNANCDVLQSHMQNKTCSDTPNTSTSQHPANCSVLKSQYRDSGCCPGRL